MNRNERGRSTSPIRPGDADYLWLKRLETKVKQGLGMPMPNVTLQTLAEWRLDEMRRAVSVGDWDTCDQQCQRLSRMISEARQYGRSQR